MNQSALSRLITGLKIMLLCGVVAFVGCGDDDDSSDTITEPSSETTTNTEWTEIDVPAGDGYVRSMTIDGRECTLGFSVSPTGRVWEATSLSVDCEDNLENIG